jgi:hypothetical protein
MTAVNAENAGQTHRLLYEFIEGPLYDDPPRICPPGLFCWLICFISFSKTLLDCSLDLTRDLLFLQSRVRCTEGGD